MKLILITTLVFLTGCNLIEDNFFSDDETVAETNSVYGMTSHEQLFESNVTGLITQLTANSKFDFKNKPTAVTTFVWSDTLSIKQIEQPKRMFGHLLAESVKHELTAIDGMMIEFRSGSSLSVSPQASHFLSRDLDNLSGNVNVDYVIAGTLLESENGIWVHAEAIDIYTKEITASARQFFSNESISYKKPAVYMRDGKIYRNETMGSSS